MPRTIRRGRAAIAIALAGLAILAAPARAAGDGGVLVVGDSLAELSSPYLEKYLPGVPLTINAVGGSNSYEILDLFQESYDPTQSVIVFDAGTNDNPAYPQILAENLRTVAATVGNRCMVVPTVHGYTVNGINNDGKNRTVTEFAASRPGTQVPDWAGAVTRHPELMQADGLHPIEAGSELRARLIAEGIAGCLAVAETTLPGAPSTGAGAGASAAPQGPPVDVKRFSPVNELVSQQTAIYESVATTTMRQVLLVAIAQALLPG